MEQFCEDLPPWRVFGQVAPKCGILSVKVAGSYGTIQSAPADHIILGAYARTGSWAPRTNELLSTFFHERSGCYIDIGANIGLTTIPVAQNPLVRCIAIEPEPVNFANLTANIDVNCRHGNVELHQIAAFNRQATLRFEIAASGNLGDHRLRLQDKPGLLGEHGWATIEVDAAPLDDIVGSVERPLAVKIDTQGAEPYVVDGGRRILADADLIISEWSPYWMARMGSDPAIMTTFLSDHFRELAVATGEGGAFPNVEPAAVAAERLLELAHRYRGDPGQYFDIAARK